MRVAGGMHVALGAVETRGNLEHPDMIRGLEEALNVDARLDRQPEQPGDVPRTWARIEKARALLGYDPATDFQTGLARFASWLRDSSPASVRHALAS